MCCLLDEDLFLERISPSLIQSTLKQSTVNSRGSLGHKVVVEQGECETGKHWDFSCRTTHVEVSEG